MSSGSSLQMGRNASTSSLRGHKVPGEYDRAAIFSLMTLEFSDVLGGRGLPSADVAAAGGWRDLRSLERSYIKADEVTMLRVVTEPGRVRDAKGA